MRILAVDDDELTLEILSHALETDGHEVLAAADGREALELLRQNPVRMVITDWMMPNMDGVALCRAIRGMPLPNYVYIIMLTARSETTDVIEGLSAGADEFLAKPVDLAELQIRIRTGARILALESRHVAIFGMAKLAESRDPETGEHLERMREYTRLLARRLADAGDIPEIDTEYIETIYLTSPLHDVGKVGMPDNILLKPARLNDEEFQVMKRHTIIGGETLASAASAYPEVEYLRMARDIALTHHERFDGKGYPSGLTGDEIPLAGRIVALADVFDALISRRVYKAAYSADIARSMIETERGKHFDPHVVDAFLALRPEFGEVMQSFPET